MKVKYYAVDAKSAVAQKKEPKGEGLMISQGKQHRNGTYHTSAIIQGAEGVLVEVPILNVQVIAEKPSPKTVKKSVSNSK